MKHQLLISYHYLMKKILNERINMENKINKFLKVYPWYYGLSCWLIFYDILNTIYLTAVKNLTASEFTLLTSIGLLTSIILLSPTLKIIKKIGNTISLRLGNFMFIVATILLIFCNSFIGLSLGQILYEISFLFKTMLLVELRKNLIYINKENKFIEYGNKASMKYYVVALISGLIAGPIFNINHYLPMYISLIITFICFYLSFYLFDVTEYDNTYKIEKNANIKIKKIWSILSIILLITFGLETGIIDIGIDQAKLFIQYSLTNKINIKIIAIIISIVVALSNIPAILGTKFFPKIYDKIKDKSGYLLSFLLILSFTLLLIGGFINAPLIIKIILMAIGYILIVMLKGPYTVYLEDLILKNGKGLEQDLTMYFTLARNLGGAIISALASIILIYHSITHVIWLLLLISIIETYLFYKVNKLLK